MIPYPQELTVRPLAPGDWPGALTPSRDRAVFTASIGQTLVLLGREQDHLRARGALLQIALPPGAERWRQDGRPRAAATPEHPGVLLVLPDTRHGPLRYAVDRFTTWQDNLRGIALALEALRRVERYGVVRDGEQYRGWRALPARASAEDPRAALGRIAGLDPARTAHLPASRLVRAARAATHPDRHGGDTALWGEVEAVVASAGWLSGGC